VLLIGAIVPFGTRRIRVAKGEGSSHCVPFSGKLLGVCRPNAARGHISPMDIGGIAALAATQAMVFMDKEKPNISSNPQSIRA